MRIKTIIVMVVTVIVLSALLPGCEPIPYYWSEGWNASINIDGSRLNFICETRGAPFFIPDPDNEGEEIILLDRPYSISLMNQDGSNYRTVIDSAGGVYRFTEERNRILMECDDDIYIANTDGSELMNLTNTPDVIEEGPDLSFDGNMVIYEYCNVVDSLAIIGCYDFIENSNYDIYQESYTDYSPDSSGPPFIHFCSPVFIDETTIIYGASYLGLDGIYGLYSYNMIEHNVTLIDSGYVNGKITYEKHKNLVMYKKSSYNYIYYPETGGIIEIGDIHSYHSYANFNRDGSLFNFAGYIFDTESLENYYILQYYRKYASGGGNLDFNHDSTKVIMAVNREYPASEGFE